jgi:hypothetical protein
LLPLLWPYAVAGLAVLFWLGLSGERLESRLAYALTAFITCLVTVQAIDYACTYLVPLDVAGTPPPDPRNARLRFLITAAVQIPAALVIAYLIARRVRGRSPN